MKYLILLFWKGNYKGKKLHKTGGQNTKNTTNGKKMKKQIYDLIFVQSKKKNTPRQHELCIYQPYVTVFNI